MGTYANDLLNLL